MPPGFELNPLLDVEALSREYRDKGRVQLAPFIAPESAEALRAHLLDRDDWQLKLKGPVKQSFSLDRRILETWGPAQVEALRKTAAPAGQDSFCYLYESILVRDEHNVSLEKGSPVADFAAFLSSTAIVALVRAISGEGSVNFADAFASRYRGGDFLTVHHDRREGSARLVAYVFGLTPVWRPEWGGLLLFHGEDGEVRAGLMPRFNVLSLFSIPQDHSVSLVAPFAPVPRLSVTGWFRSNSNITAPDNLS